MLIVFTLHGVFYGFRFLPRSSKFLELFGCHHSLGLRAVRCVGNLLPRRHFGLPLANILIFAYVFLLFCNKLTLHPTLHHLRAACQVLPTLRDRRNRRASSARGRKRPNDILIAAIKNRKCSCRVLSGRRPTASAQPVQSIYSSQNTRKQTNLNNSLGSRCRALQLARQVVRWLAKLAR